MAKSQQRQREEIWASHILNWKKSSVQIRAYCREKGISHNSFYYWRKRLGSRFPVIQREKTLPISPFVPVSINREVNSASELPDSKWLGEFAAALIRGLR